MNHHSQSLFKIWSQRVGDCVQCGLHESAKTVCLLGDGPTPCEGMILGEAPGGTEDENEIPFCGKSGLFLRRMLKEIGLDPKSLYFTNVVHCRPPANRTPTRKEIKICAPLYLQRELDVVKPKVILLLGNTALSWALGRKAAITKAEGSTFSLNGYTCVPSRHPSSVVRMEDDPTLRKDFLFAQQKFRENLLLFKRTLNPPKDEFIYEKNLRLVKEADADVPIYGDIETNGLNFSKPDAKIHCISVCRIPGRVAAVRMTDENVLITKEMLLKHPIMVQRGTFEGTWFLWHFGILPRIYHDTKLGAFVQDETDNTGLKYQAIKCLGVEPWSEEQDWENPDYGKLLPYNARDSQYGLRLYRERDLPFLKRNPKVARLLRYILLPAEEVFTKVICRGAHINMEDAKKKLAIVEAEEEKIQKKINKIAGKEVNIGSPKQMSKLFYDQLKLPCPVKTKKGKQSTAEAALIRLKLISDHPAIDLLWSWRGWNKKKTTYLLPWIERGPLLRFNYGFTDTDTGRLNSTAVKDKRYQKKLGATIHQCPREGFIRNLITPRGYSTPPWELWQWEQMNKKPKPIKAHPEDWCIIAADLSQIELRLVAHASGDPTMCKIFQNPSNTPEGDIHYQTARSLKPTGEIDKETRKKAKSVNFGFVFKLKAPGFIVYALEKFDLKLTLAEGKDYRRKFFKKYSGLNPWHDSVERFVAAHGYIDSVFGRRRHLREALAPREEECESCHGEDDSCFLCGGSGLISRGETEEFIRWRAIRQGINSPIQSAASDLQLLIASLLMSPSLPWKYKVDESKAFMIGSAHDSQLYECHRSYASELKAAILDILDSLPEITEKFFNFRFKVPIEMDVTGYESQWEGKVLEI